MNENQQSEDRKQTEEWSAKSSAKKQRKQRRSCRKNFQKLRLQRARRRKKLVRLPAVDEESVVISGAVVNIDHRLIPASCSSSTSES